MSTVFYTNSFLLDQASGVHDLGTDALKMALFSADAGFSQNTTTYSSTHEVATGGGYTTGGITLTVATSYPKLEGGRAAVRIEDVLWTLTTPKAIKYALVYNATQSNKSIMVFDFGAERFYLNAFSFSFPLTQPALFIAAIPAA
jgi:hypothetical protein